MKKGDLVKWKKGSRFRGWGIFGYDDIGLVINGAWTGNWVWILWGNIDAPQLCSKDALAAV